MVFGFSKSLVTGASGSRTEDNKALTLCRERKHLVRQALDGRCALAEAHVSYIQSLKNTGIAIRMLVEAEPWTESSLGTSTSATPEPLTSTEKSTPQLSNSSPSFSQQAEGADSLSPSSSSTYSGRIQAVYMKSSRGASRVVEERPRLALRGTVRSSSDESPPADSSVPSETRGWDYFGIFHPIDGHFTFTAGGSKSPNGVPEAKKSTPRSSDGLDSENELEKVRSQVVDLGQPNGSPDPEVQTLVNGEKTAGGIPDLPPPQVATVNVSSLSTGKDEGKRENFPEEKAHAKDLFTSVKEIELLFVKASESGVEIPRMLEANKFKFSLLSSNGRGSRSRGSTLLAAFLICCRNELHVTQDPPAAEMKYLTWHRSVSSISSFSRSPQMGQSKDDMEPTSSSIFGGACMNSGSHASTLDRLYAWERKLYDEVKANGALCRQYDAKCRLLRDQDLRGEKPIVVDKTRAGVKDLHSRIGVAIHRIDSISRKIEEIRDAELHPQLEELISGLTRMWVMMLECHRLQHEIIQAAAGGAAVPRASPRPEQLRQAAAALQAELNGLNASFGKWIAAHRFYVQAINNWLLKCLKRVEQRRRTKKADVFPPLRATGPPIYVACRLWLDELEKLPIKDTSESIKRLAAVSARIMPREERKNTKATAAAGREGGGMAGGGEAIDWTSCLEALQRGLADLLGNLEVFAGKSEEMYKRLRSRIDDARRRYEGMKAAEISQLS